MDFCRTLMEDLRYTCNLYRTPPSKWCFFFFSSQHVFGIFIACKSFEGIVVTDKFEFSGGRGKRGRGGHHPSGLTGKQIGLWHRDKGKNRELKQV